MLNLRAGYQCSQQKCTEYLVKQVVWYGRCCSRHPRISRDGTTFSVVSSARRTLLCTPLWVSTDKQVSVEQPRFPEIHCVHPVCSEVSWTKLMLTRIFHVIWLQKNNKRPWCSIRDVALHQSRAGRGATGRRLEYSAPANEELGSPWGRLRLLHALGIFRASRVDELTIYVRQKMGLWCFCKIFFGRWGVRYREFWITIAVECHCARRVRVH